MNTKNIVAIMMASIIAMALFAPTAMAQGTDVVVTVPNAAPYICDKWEEPEVVEPDPLGPVPVTIHACVCDPNGEGDIDTVVAYTPKGAIPLLPSDVDCSACTCVHADLPCVGYSGTFEMDPCDPAGKYAITVIATDTNGAKSNAVTNEFEYLSIVYLDIGFDQIIFEEIVFGEKQYVSPGYIHNMGNDKMRIRISATAMTGEDGDESEIILDAGVGVEEYDLLPPDVPVEFKHIFKCCVETPIEFSIFVPFGTPPGAYSGTITIEGDHVVECTETIDLGSAIGPGDDCSKPSGVLDPTWDWSDKVATTHTGGNYGGIGGCGARMVWGANTDPDVPGDEWASVMFFDCERNCLQAITVKHLDGLTDDSFDVFVNGDCIGSYAWSGDTTEYWVVSTFPVEYGVYHCPVEVKLVATGDAWGGLGRYGQLAIDWIQMTCCESCEDS
jgi:hypothetical protein